MYRIFIILVLCLSCSESHKIIPHGPVNVYSAPYMQRQIFMKWGKFPEVRIRAIDEGSGTPILLIHGHQSRLEEYIGLVPGLSENHRVIIPDLPGSGYSEQLDITYSLNAYTDFIATFIKEYVKEPVVIAGGSMGGNLALKVSREFPDLVIDTIAWSPAGVWPEHNIMAFLADTFIDGPLYRTILGFQSKYWFSKNSKDEDIDRAFGEFIKYIDEVDSPIFRRMAAQMAADQLRGSNSHIGKGHLNKQPTLIIAGALDDGLELAKYAIKFYEELPNGSLIVFYDAGHCIAGERTKELIKIMNKFISK